MISIVEYSKIFRSGLILTLTPRQNSTGLSLGLHRRRSAKSQHTASARFGGFDFTITRRRGGRE